MVDIPNMPEKVRETLEAIIAKLAESYQPERIILFGSYANGTADDESDLDLLVIKDVAGKFLERQRSLDAAMRGMKRKMPLDIFVISPREFNIKSKSSYFYQEIAETGVNIYDSRRT